MVDSEFGGQLTGMHRSRAAKREQRETTRVEAAFDRDQPHRASHVRVDHPNHAQRGRIGGAFHRAAQMADGAHRTIGKQAHPAAQKIGCHQPSRDQVGVGYGWFLAMSIAGRTGVGPGALRPDLERAALIDPRQGTAAGAHGMDIDDRGADGIPSRKAQ